MTDATYNAESVVFTPHGVWIRPAIGQRFIFSGSVAEFLAILIAHTELDITRTRFYVSNRSPFRY